MTKDEYITYLSAIDDCKMTAAQKMRCHMVLMVIEAVEAGVNSRQALHDELKSAGVILPDT